MSSRVRLYSQADAIVVSIPKSGRTWLRFFLHAYFCALEKRAFTLDQVELVDSKMPKMIFTHDLWQHLTISRLKHRLLGKDLVPRRASLKKRILLLARDPRDIIVSLFFQITKRDKVYNGVLSEMIRHPKFGIGLIIEIMNTWIAEWGSRSNFKLVRYEDCRLTPEKTFREVLGFLGCGEIDESILTQSLEFSSFESMKTMEATGQFKTKKLLPGDVDDPESFKVRRGVIGGHREYLSLEDLYYLEEAMSRLDQRYGYDRERTFP